MNIKEKVAMYFKIPLYRNVTNIYYLDSISCDSAGYQTSYYHPYISYYPLHFYSLLSSLSTRKHYSIISTISLIVLLLPLLRAG